MHIVFVFGPKTKTILDPARRFKNKQRANSGYMGSSINIEVRFVQIQYYLKLGTRKRCFPFSPYSVFLYILSGLTNEGRHVEIGFFYFSWRENVR